MRTLILILFTMLFSSTAFAATKQKCENGECIPRLVKRLENLSEKYVKDCLQGNSQTDLVKYHRENGLSEECWKTITKISELEDKLLAHQNRLEAKPICTDGGCKEVLDINLSEDIQNLSQVGERLTCNEDKKKEIKDSCRNDLLCHYAAGVAGASSFGLGAYAIDKILTQNNKIKDCDLGNDNCSVQIATGFLKSGYTFFNGVWSLLRLGGQKFWDLVAEGENHSSTTQLALAQASEEPSIFSNILNDFPGTMERVYFAFMDALRIWLKEDIFCNKWKGVPHFSQCLEPSYSFDCVTCKSMLNGLCGLQGTFVAEIIPSFFSGGLIRALKYGVKGSAAIAKGFKVSKVGLDKIKNSKLATAVGSKAPKASAAAYLLSRARNATKASFQALNELTKEGKLYVVVSSAGRALSFTGKAAKTAMKVVLFPVDNKMTALAFRGGAKTVDDLIKHSRSKSSTIPELPKPPMNISRGATVLVTPSTKTAHTSEDKKKKRRKARRERQKHLEEKNTQILK